MSREWSLDPYKFPNLFEICFPKKVETIKLIGFEDLVILPGILDLSIITWAWKQGWGTVTNIASLLGLDTLKENISFERNILAVSAKHFLCPGMKLDTLHFTFYGLLSAAVLGHTCEGTTSTFKRLHIFWSAICSQHLCLFLLA